MVWLIVAKPTVPGTGAVSVQLWSDTGWVADAAAPYPFRHFKRCVSQPLERTRSLFGTAVGDGAGAFEAGRIVADNGRGDLDALLDLDWDGAPIEIRRSLDADADPNAVTWAQTAVEFAGWVRQMVPGSELALELDDVDTLLGEALQPLAYAGTGGAQGSAAMAGRRVPWSGGLVRQVAPDLLDEDKNLFRWSVGPVYGILELSDGGDLYLAPGADYPAGTDLTAIAIPSGVDYITCHAEATLCTRLKPQLGLRLTGKGQLFGPLGWRGDVAGMMMGVLSTRLDLAAHGAGMNTATLDALAMACPHALGDYVAGDSSGTIAEAFARWRASAEIWCGFDEDRLWTASLFDGPAAVADADLYLSAHEVEPQPVDRRPKSWRIGHGRRWAPLGRDEIAGSVTDQAARDALQREWLWAEGANPHLSANAVRVAEPAERQTHLDDPAAAAWLLARLQATYGPLRRAYRVPLDKLPAGFRLGRTVRLTSDGHGLQAGRNLVLVTKEFEPRGDRPYGVLWG